MSEISEFVDRYIYPAVYDIAPQIFPEFDLVLHGDKWISSNKRKIDGTYGDSDKKVTYLKKAPFCLNDFRGINSKEIATYLVEQRGFNTWIEAVKYLSRETGIPLPNYNLNDEAIEGVKKKEKQTELFTVINDFFITSLLVEKGERTDELRKYLDGRSYTEYLPKSHDEIHASNKMELGFFPSQEKLKEYLKSVNIELEVIDSLFIKDIGSFHMKSCGSTHQLTIPYRDHSGRIIGFVFRNINHKEGDKPDKYLCSCGLSRKETLFKLNRIKNKEKELTLIEGYLDVMFLKAIDVDNVAGLGGVGFNIEQVKLAKQFGAESITLWLDNDKTGTNSTDSIIDLINKNDSNIKIYVVEIPEEYKKKDSDERVKDPDELIRDYGIDAYHKVIKTARPWYIYQLDKILNQLAETFTDKDRDRLLSEISQLGSKISDPIDSDNYKKHLKALEEKIGVSGEAIKIAIENIKQNAENEKRLASLKNGLDSAQGHMKYGDIEKALNEIKNIDKQFSANTKKIDYDDLIIPDNEEEIIKALKKKPDSLYSGYEIFNPDTKTPYKIQIPSAAITVVGAPTGHGKTTKLINLALNLVDEIPKDKSIYFFTFEEQRHALYIKFLNTYINKYLNADNRAFIEAKLKSGVIDSGSHFAIGREEYKNEIMNPRKIKINYVTFSANELIKAIHHAYEYGNAGAIMIDYVQLLQVEDKDKFNNRQEEVKQLCQDLKICANDSSLPIIAAAQFNRDVNGINDLVSTKIREAGDIEQVSNLILGLWNKTKRPEKEAIDKFISEPKIYIRIMKNRDGISDIGGDFSFDGNTGKIGDRLIKTDSKIDNSLSSKRNIHTETSPEEYAEASRG